MLDQLDKLGRESHVGILRFGVATPLYNILTVGLYRTRITKLFKGPELGRYRNKGSTIT